MTPTLSTPLRFYPLTNLLTSSVKALTLTFTLTLTLTLTLILTLTLSIINCRHAVPRPGV